MLLNIESITIKLTDAMFATTKPITIEKRMGIFILTKFIKFVINGSFKHN